MAVQVEVENLTGRVISTVGCGYIFQVLLIGNGKDPTPTWPTCAQRVRIPIGESSYPTEIKASFLTCQDTATSCAPGPQWVPLPAGTYEATTFERGGTVPVPAPVTIDVTG